MKKTAKLIENQNETDETASRTPWPKTFQVAPSQRLKMSFGTQIHYLNPETKVYDSIDNTFISCEGRLQNKANGDMSVELLEDRIALTHREGYRVCWSIDGAEKTAPAPLESKWERELAIQYAKEDLFGHLKEPYVASKLSDEQQKGRDTLAEALAEELSHVSSDAIYREIFPGTDLICHLSGTVFKDNFVFAAREQALRKETISYVTHYTWVDADGTEIYFSEENGIWKDQTGREMTLTFENGAAVISDKQGGKRFFGIPTAEFDGNWANAKVLYRIENALGQHIDIQSDSPGHSLRVLNITDGAGRTTGTQWEGANITRLLPPGDAVGISLIYSEWYHVGVYLGKYTDPLTGIMYTDAVIQAANLDDGIKVSSLTDTDFTNYGFAPFIAYVITAFFILSSFFMQATAKGIAANGDDEVSKWGKFRFLPDREYYSNYDIARTWYLVSTTGNFSRVIYTFDDLTDCCFVRFDDTHAFIFETSNYDPIERFQLFNAEGQLSENEFRNLEIDYSRELLFPYPIFNMNCDGGYIDQDCNWSIQPQYLDISPFVRMDSFNAGHREIMQLNPDKIRDGTLVALVLEGENYKIINTENETLYYIGRYDSGRLTDTILDILDF